MNKSYGQAGRPSGFIGRVLGHIMAWHNQSDNDWTVDLLGISSAENILEIGYGPGKAIEKAHSMCPKCKIVGIDHSVEMLNSAYRRNREAIATGAVDLRLGDVGSLNFAEGTFDKAFSINCIYFWSGSGQGLQELYRVLKVGGKLAITVRDKKREAYWKYSGENLKKMLSEAGFSGVEIRRNDDSSHPLLCGIGVK